MREQDRFQSLDSRAQRLRAEVGCGVDQYVLAVAREQHGRTHAVVARIGRGAHGAAATDGWDAHGRAGTEDSELQRSCGHWQKIAAGPLWPDRISAPWLCRFMQRSAP